MKKRVEYVVNRNISSKIQLFEHSDNGESALTHYLLNQDDNYRDVALEHLKRIFSSDNQIGEIKY